jgi:hypothetical protein
MRKTNGKGSEQMVQICAPKIKVQLMKVHKAVFKHKVQAICIKKAAILRFWAKRATKTSITASKL